MAEVNGVAELNRILASMPMLKYKGTRTTIVMVNGPSLPGHGGASIKIPMPVSEEYEYFGSAECISSSITAVSDLDIGTSRTTALPDKIVKQSKRIDNNSSASVSSTISMSVSETKQWSIAKTNGVSTTNNQTFGVNFQLPYVGTANISLTFSTTISSSTTVSESQSETITRSSSETVTIGANKSIDIEYFAYRSGAEVPISAKIVIDGKLKDNLSGYNYASELIEATKRTFSFSAAIALYDVSKAFLRVTEDGKAGMVGQGNSERALVIDRVLGVSRFYQPVDSFDLPEVAGIPGQPEGPVIGPPDGVEYEILYSYRIMEPAIACGLNDLGLPNPGTFLIEARRYREWNNGTLLRTWDEEHKTFDSCIPI